MEIMREKEGEMIEGKGGKKRTTCLLFIYMFSSFINRYILKKTSIYAIFGFGLELN